MKIRLRSRCPVSIIMICRYFLFLLLAHSLIRSVITLGLGTNLPEMGGGYP